MNNLNNVVSGGRITQKNEFGKKCDGKDTKKTARTRATLQEGTRENPSRTAMMDSIGDEYRKKLNKAWTEK